jgi:hypothetical protein
VVGEPNQRLYRTEIQVCDPAPEMRPGMSVSIDILADTLADCLSVPLQSIVLDKGKTTAFVVDGTKIDQRDVKVGRSNDAKVEVLKGWPRRGSAARSAARLHAHRLPRPEKARASDAAGVRRSRCRGRERHAAARRHARGGETQRRARHDGAMPPPTAGGAIPARGTAPTGLDAPRNAGGDGTGRRRRRPRRARAEAAPSHAAAATEKQGDGQRSPGGNRD